MTSGTATRSVAAPRRAVVIGGSMAGLLTGRVLVDHFDEVVIVERDPLPEGPEHRKGVPQGSHLHGLLNRGMEILEQLFPGISEAYLRAGAVRFDGGQYFYWHHFGGWKARFPSGLMVTWMSRPLIEAEVRGRVFALPNVVRRDAHEVTGLIPGADRSGLDGVRLRASPGGPEETLPAALVVDASGRGSASTRWLTELGFPAPEESKVVVDIGYATRYYRRVEPSPFPWKGLFVLGSHPHKRSGAITPVEGDRWIAFVAGVLHDYPPSDDAGWLAFAQSLPDDSLYRAARSLEPVSDITTYRFSSHQRRHYERVERLPERFVVVGDALCSFNPTYGQGMTTAALEAVELGECLRQQGGELRGLSRRFHDRVARVIEVPWLMSTSEDLRWPEVEGKRPPGFAALSWFLARTHRAVQHDPVLMGQFLRVMHMIDSPARLFRPGPLLRILRG